MNVNVNLMVVSGMLAFCAVAEGVAASSTNTLSSVDKNKRGMLLDGVAAYVNADMITISDVMNEVRRAPMDGVAPEKREKRLRELYKITLDAMIDRRLILDAAKKAKLQLQSWAVDERVREIIANNFDGDRAKLHELLSNHKISLEEWRKSLEEDLTISALRYQQVEKRVAPTPSEIREEYEKSRASYSTESAVTVSLITLDPPAPERDSIQVRSQKIADGLKAGQTFADLAKQYSSDSKAAQGGSWGKVNPQEMFRPELVAALNALKPGEVSGLIEINGYGYIIRKDEQKDARVLTFEEAHALIESRLKMRQSEKLYKEWIARLRSEAYIKIFELPTK